MKDWINELCGEGFMPHGQCYLWNKNLIILHGASDFFIALAYLSIPLILISLIRRRKDVPFTGIF